MLKIIHVLYTIFLLSIDITVIGMDVARVALILIQETKVAFGGKITFFSFLNKSTIHLM